MAEAADRILTGVKGMADNCLVTPFHAAVILVSIILGRMKPGNMTLQPFRTWNTVFSITAMARVPRSVSSSCMLDLAKYWLQRAAIPHRINGLVITKRWWRSEPAAEYCMRPRSYPA